MKVPLLDREGKSVSFLIFGQQKEESIQQILQLHSLLESCQFKEFWQAARENQSLMQLVVGFEATVRNCEYLW